MFCAAAFPVVLCVSVTVRISRVLQSDLPTVVVHGNADGNDKRKFKSTLQVRRLAVHV